MGHEDAVIITSEDEVIVQQHINVGAFTSFVAPLVRRVNYSDIARQMFTIEPLPPGALSIFDKIEEDK